MFILAFRFDGCQWKGSQKERNISVGRRWNLPWPWHYKDVECFLLAMADILAVVFQHGQMFSGVGGLNANIYGNGNFTIQWAGCVNKYWVLDSVQIAEVHNECTSLAEPRVRFQDHAWMLFHVSLRFISFGDCLRHSAYCVPKSGRKTTIFIILLINIGVLVRGE